jgi:hypothetical protein
VFLSRLPQLFTTKNSDYSTTSPASSFISITSPPSSSLSPFTASQQQVAVNPVNNVSSGNSGNNSTNNNASTKSIFSSKPIASGHPTSIPNQASSNSSLFMKSVPVPLNSSLFSSNTPSSSNIINLTQPLSSSFPSSSSASTTVPSTTSFMSNITPVVETKPVFSTTSSTTDILHNISQMNNALVLEKFSNPEKLKDLNLVEKKLEVINFWNQRLSVS